MKDFIWVAVAALDGSIIEAEPIKCDYDRESDKWAGIGRSGPVETEFIGEVMSDKLVFSSPDYNEVQEWVLDPNKVVV